MSCAKKIKKEDVLRVEKNGAKTAADRIIRDHLEKDGCDACANVIETDHKEKVRHAAYRMVADLDIDPDDRSRAKSKSTGHAAPIGIAEGLALALATFIPGLLNRDVSYRGADSASLSLLDHYRAVQSGLVHNGLWVAIGIVGLAVAAAAIARLRGLRTVTRVACAALAGLLVISAAVYANAEVHRRATMTAMNKVFLDHKWVSYDSPSFHPEKHKDVTMEEMTRELKPLHDQANFDGLVTFNISPDVAEVAAAQHFKAVVLGVYVEKPENNPEKWEDDTDKSIRRAIRHHRDHPQNIIVGYIVGHNASNAIPLDKLAAWMQELRSATGKPVTSTFQLANYQGPRGEKIRELGDFYAPDIQEPFQHDPTPHAMVLHVRSVLSLLMQLPEKPIMMQMVCYPAFPPDRDPKTVPNMTEKDQADFYTELTRDVFLPPGIQLAVFAGLNVSWKGSDEHKDEFAPSEEFVGLFTKDGKPKQAVEVLKKAWSVNNRP
jgi:hypothetical protein